MDHLIQVNNFDSCLNLDRTKIDESLVSLRFLKQIDDFLEQKDLSNRDLANKLGYSESYISQLMTGSKKINISFISKFEKYYHCKFDVKLKKENKHNYVKFHSNREIFEINIKIDINFSGEPIFNKTFFNTNLIEISDATIK